MDLAPDKLRLYVIIDPEHCLLDPIDVAARALEAGARTIQLRDKSNLDRARTRAIQIKTLCDDYGALFFVNDFVELAVEIGAHGVHVGPHDMPVVEVKKLSPDLLVGTSCGSRGDVQKAIDDGADYVGVGALFEARTIKSDASPPRGVGIIEEVSALGIPIVGIGGITQKNAASVWRAGADGVALIRAICGSPDPGSAVKELLGTFDR